MKIWFKYLMGIALGIGFAIFAPAGWASDSSVSAFISEFCISIGRYVLYPVLFFTFTVAIYELRTDRQLVRLGLKIIASIIVAMFLATFVGIVSVYIFSPSRIPVFVEDTAESFSRTTLVTGIRTYMRSLFPSNMFAVFSDGLFILPLLIVAALIGGASSVDKLIAKPVLTLFDSCSRVFYTIASFFVDFLAVAMIGISFYWVLCYREMLHTDIFQNLILVLVFDALVLLLIVYPLLLRIYCKKINPFRVLYAALAPIIVAFFSGDSNMVLPVVMRHSRESLGMRRRITSVSLPLFSVFCRAGTALTVVSGFMIVLKSYSSIMIDLSDVISVAMIVVGLSFLLGQVPCGGAYMTLALVCGLYGHGFEAGYLILKPAAFFMGAIAAVIDVASAMFCSFIIAHSEGMVHDRELRFFI